MTKEIFFLDIIIAIGGMLTGAVTCLIALSRASGKKFENFEDTCDLKYASKESQSQVDVQIGKIFTSLKNIEKDIDSMGRTLSKKLS